MREKVGLIGILALVAAVWAAGYLWQTGRIDLSSGPSVAAEATPSPSPPSPSPPATTQRESPTARPTAPGTDPDFVVPGPDRRPGVAREGSPQARSEQGRTVQARAAEARATQARAARARTDRFFQGGPPAEPPPTLQLRVATFNVLGASHTAGNAPRFRRFASGTDRVSSLLQVLASRQIDVAGLQEFQPVQRAVFARRAPGWATYPGGSAFDVGTTSVTWRTDRFELVEGRLDAMPFYGTTRAVPSVLLRDRASGVQTWVSTVHNPADTGKYPRQQGAREVATARQISLVRELGAPGVPVILTGDMNEKAAYFCRFTSRTGFTSPAGGDPGAGGCRAPGDSGVDWIFGSPALQWTSYLVDRSSLVRRTTDHPVRVADVRIDAGDFPGSWSPTAG